ncbi:MAG: leucyl aminopeptidase [Candidatus Zixiibacteriota bacterium]
MRLTVNEFNIGKLKCDLLVLILSSENLGSESVRAIDRLLKGQISTLRAERIFSANTLEHHEIIPHPARPFKRLMLIGLGKHEDIHLDLIRKAAGLAGQSATRKGTLNSTIVLPRFSATKLNAASAIQAVVEGFNLGSYFNDSLKSGEPKRIHPAKLSLLSQGTELRGQKDAAENGLIISNLQNHCRDLSACPSNILTPGFLATEARRIGRKHGLQVQVLRKPQIEKLKMSAFLAVAKGSNEPPYLLRIDYKPKGKAKKRAILVGKGVTFDTGGISIKPADNMGEMKQDMTGAAVVLCTMAALAQLKPQVQVTAYIPTCENMLSGSAYKPGDVVTTSIGKTIEIVNTDAEGRLLLADVLGYAAGQRPDYLLDVATLTGAVTVALGHGGAGILSTSEELVGKFFAASNRTGEKVWQLPLWEEYENQFKSGVADMTNSGGRPAGTITAALILKQFTGGLPWLHMDIAGVDFEYRGSEYIPRGASGFGVRVLTEALCSL